MRTLSRIDYIAEFKFALADGLGRNVANQHEIFLWEAGCQAAIAHSSDGKSLYLLVDGTNEQEGRLTPNEYLDQAKLIGAEFKAFIVPDQGLQGNTFWGGKTRGPIIAYKFRVIDQPALGFKRLARV